MLSKTFDECESFGAQSAAVVAAGFTSQFSRVRSFAGTNDGDVAAARLLPIDLAIEPPPHRRQSGRPDRRWRSRRGLASPGARDASRGLDCGIEDAEAFPLSIEGKELVVLADDAADVLLAVVNGECVGGIRVRKLPLAAAIRLW